MITAPLPTTARRRDTACAIRAAAVGVGVGILLARPAIAALLGWTVPAVVLVFLTVLALGLAPPVRPAEGRLPLLSAKAVAVLAAGSLVFVAGRIVAAGHPPARATALLVGLNTLAAVAEEALFRRLAFDVLLAAGPLVAIGGSALLFGLAHVTVYGWWAFPLDTAAGAVLGWQRWTTGTWTFPAVTHALADLLVVI